MAQTQTTADWSRPLTSQGCGNNALKTRRPYCAQGCFLQTADSNCATVLVDIQKFLWSQSLKNMKETTSELGNAIFENIMIFLLHEKTTEIQKQLYTPILDSIHKIQTTCFTRKWKKSHWLHWVLEKNGQIIWLVKIILGYLRFLIRKLIIPK